jgi:cation transport regulator
LAFVNGEDIVIPDNDDTTVSVGSEKYRLRVNERTTKALPSSKNEIIFVQKPYESWSSGYAMPFVVRRGVWRNLQLMKMLHTKGERFVAKALEYLLLMKKGTEALALTKEPNYIYSEAELKQIKDDFIKHVEETKTTAGVTPTYVANFDTLLEHLTPDYTKIINDALYSPIERKILAGLGLIDIIQGISSTRRESTLNPRPFMTEVNNGIEDFKMLVTDILQTIQDKNRKQHRKYSEETLVIHNTPVKAFLTDEIRTHLRSLYDRGCLSKRTYTEVVGDTDFDIEVDRRKTEAKNKIEKIMYPHIVQNQEGVGIDFTSDDVPVLKQLFKPPLPKPAPGAPTDNIPTSKTGIEKKNFTKAEEDDIDEEGGLFEAFSPEVTESYERIRIKDPNDFQKDFFRIISISKTKGIKAVIGRAKGSTSTTVQSYLFVKDDWTIAEAEEWVSQHRGSYEEGPYKTVQQLPPAVKKYPKGAQEVFKSAFNSALKQYGDETTAFKVAWAALKNWMKSHKGEEDAKE